MRECRKGAQMLTSCLFVKGLGLKGTDRAWSAVSIAEILKKARELQILLYRRHSHNWHFLSSSSTDSDPDWPTRQRMGTSDRHQVQLLHMDRHGRCELQRKDTGGFSKVSTATQLSRLTERDRDTAAVRSSFPGGCPFLWLDTHPQRTTVPLPAHHHYFYQGFSSADLMESSLTMSTAAIPTLWKTLENAQDVKTFVDSLPTACQSWVIQLLNLSP